MNERFRVLSEVFVRDWVTLTDKWNFCFFYIASHTALETLFIDGNDFTV